MMDRISQTQTLGTSGVAGLRRLGLQFKAANIVSGSAVFKVQGTTNGADWAFVNLVDNLSNTNSQNLTRVASKTLSANSNVLMWVDEGLALRAIRVSATITTDGSYSAYLIASE